MKKKYLLISLCMLVLFVTGMCIGIYAAQPTGNLIEGVVTIIPPAIFKL